MEREKGILLGGGGREEPQAELSENERVFNELSGYLYRELGDFFPSLDYVKRDVVRGVRYFMKETDFSLDDLLNYMFRTKEDRVNDLKQRIEKIKKEEEWKRMQEIFSGLGKFSDITDTVEGSTSRNSDEQFN